MSFEPLIDTHSKILILGTYPSLVSLEENFYYMHPRNQFWPILAKLFDMPIQSIEDKKALCFQQGIALWDIFSEIKRKENNSLDSNLIPEAYNAIDTLLIDYPNISHIAFTGKTAQKNFNRIFKTIKLPQIDLPSPSAAYASASFDDKYQRFRQKLLPLLNKKHLRF